MELLNNERFFKQLRQKLHNNCYRSISNKSFKYLAVTKSVKILWRFTTKKKPIEENIKQNKTFLMLLLLLKNCKKTMNNF